MLVFFWKNWVPIYKDAKTLYYVDYLQYLFCLIQLFEHEWLSKEDNFSYMRHSLYLMELGLDYLAKIEWKYYFIQASNRVLTWIWTQLVWGGLFQVLFFSAIGAYFPWFLSFERRLILLHMICEGWLRNYQVELHPVVKISIISLNICRKCV